MNKLKHLVACILLTQTHGAYAEDLMTIYQQALEADPETKAAALSVEISKEQSGQALGQLLPQISGSTNWSINEQTSKNNASREISSSYDGTRYYVSLNQSLLDFTKFWNWRRTHSITEQYDAQNLAAQHALMHKVIEKYFAVLEAEDQLFFYQTERAAMAKRLEQTQKLYAKQLTKITDVYEVEARLDQLKASEIEAETIVVTAKQSLKELTNAPFSELYRLKEDVDYRTLDGELDQWIDVAKSENPTLVAQLKAIEAARDSVAAQKSKFLPEVSLQLNYFDTNTGFQGVQLGSQTVTQTAAINVSVPIFDGGISIHQLFESQHRLELAKNENEAKVRELIKETSDSFLSSNASVRRIAASKKALISATKSREAKESGFKHGVETISDILNAQQEEFKAKRELSQAKYAYIKHRAHFMRSIGMITEKNIQEVNDWLQPKSAQPLIEEDKKLDIKVNSKPTSI
jgi:outer membrane protein